MIIQRAILNNYTRFYVSDIKHLEYYPNKKIQSILGQNGSGKSSLLKELIPNVNDVKADYGKGGYKHITYLHKGDTIELIYDRDSNKHSFLFNGTELNQSGIMTTQKQLIEEHFNLTKDIHGMLLSDTVFTNMSINERKKWFTEILSDIDYTYVLKLYDKSKFRIKELNSFIKLTRSKLINDNDFLNKLDKDYESKLIYKINKLNSILEEIISEKEPYKDYDIKGMYNKLDVLTLNSRDLLDSLKKYDKSYLKNTQDKLLTKQTELNLLISQRDSISTKISKVDNLKLSENDNKSDIEYMLKEIQLEKSIIEKSNIYNLDLTNIDDIEYTYTKLLPELRDIISGLTEYGNKGNIPVKEDIPGIEQSIVKYSNMLDTINNKHSIVNKEIHKLEHVSKDKVSCPKCDNIFIPNYDENTLKHLNVKLDKLTTQQIEYTKQLNHYTELQDIYQSVVGLKTSFNNTLNNNRLLVPILTYILKHTDQLSDINTLDNILNKINIDIPTMTVYSRLLQEEKELNNKLVIFNKVNDDKLKAIFNRVRELQDEYVIVIEKINSINKDVSVLKRVKSTINRLTPMLTSMESIVYSNRDVIKNEIKKEKNRVINTIIIELKHEIHTLENELVTVRNIRNRYLTLESEVNDYEDRLKAIKILTDVLSPNKGIIGKSIVGLINDVIDRMNTIISKVWSYDIKLLPCNMDEHDLSFKFPVMLGDKKHIKDISDGSSAIQEIINLAFKVVGMTYLNILDYPLILDEFGSKMDPKHRIIAYDLIEELSREYFSQVFIVSHFESMYSRFTDTDVVVLSNDNIGYTGVFNKVITLK